MLPNVLSFDEGPLVQKVFMTPSPLLKATAVLKIRTQKITPRMFKHLSHNQNAPSQLIHVKEKFGLRRERRPIL